MYLKTLSLINFRNFRSFDYEASQRINCFVGNNGVGKTNLLDAIHYLSFSKSFINYSDRLNITHGEDMFLIQGEYERNGSNEKIFCAFKTGQKKVLKRNGKEYEKLSDHIGFIPLVYALPADSTMIFGGSDLRRRFIDQVISQFDHNYLSELIAYNHGIEQRNKMLKDLQQGSSLDKLSFDVWDEFLSEKATYIFKVRTEFIEGFQESFQKYFELISKGSEKVELLYQSQLASENSIALLRQSFQRDRLFQFTTTGIHRDELIFKIEGHALKSTGSQGQQKSFLAALKFAQFDFIKIKTSLAPILLLDDIFDKLDHDRVDQIVNIVSGEQFGQIFITDTDERRIREMLKKINIENKILNICE